MFRLVFLLTALSLLLQIDGNAQSKRGNSRPAKSLPIIDMHIHAHTMEDFGGGNLSICLGEGKLTLPAIDPKLPLNIQDMVECEKTIRSSSSDVALKSETIAELKNQNVRRAIAMGDLSTVSDWVSADPTRLIPSLNFSDRTVKAESYRQLYKEGKFKLFGEIGAQYRGYSPTDPVYAEYFALAEELDIPVGIHMGEGPPNACPGAAHVPGQIRESSIAGRPNSQTSETADIRHALRIAVGR